MTAASGYVWFLPVYVSTKINDSDLSDIAAECTQSDIRKAMDGHFALSYSSFGSDLDVVDGGVETIGEWKNEYMLRTHVNKTHFVDYAGFTYDAVWVYVKALKQLINEGRVNNCQSFFVTGKLKLKIRKSFKPNILKTIRKRCNKIEIFKLFPYSIHR